MNIPDKVEQSEARLRDRVTDAVAEVVGRELAEELAADVYDAPPPAQKLTAYELSLLARAGGTPSRR